MIKNYNKYTIFYNFKKDKWSNMMSKSKKNTYILERREYSQVVCPYLEKSVCKLYSQNFIPDTGDFHRTRVSIYINKRSQVGFFHYSVPNACQARETDGQFLLPSTFITEQLQVILKLKSRHIGGALSKNNKSKFLINPVYL
jgi:hypothetical protein